MTDLINEYYKNLKKTIYQHAILSSKILSIEHKKILGNKKRTEEVLQNVIDIYVDKYLLASNVNTEISKILIKSPYIDIYSLEKEASAIAEYFMSNNKVFDITENEKDIVLIACIIKIANELDTLVSPYIKEDPNFNKMVSSKIEKYHKVDFIFLVDQGKKNTKLLVETVKTNARIKKQFFEIITNQNSFNKYIDIAKKDYYIAQYNFYVENLEKYNNAQARKIYEEKNIDDRFVLISAECVVASIIKTISIRENPKTYFLPVKKKFLMDNKNVKDLKKVLEIKTLKKHLKLLINYDECSKELLEVLIKNDFDYYIYCNRNSQISEQILKINKRYILGKEFIKNNPEQTAKLKKQNYQIIEELYSAVVDDNNIGVKKSEENI